MIGKKEKTQFPMEIGVSVVVSELQDIQEQVRDYLI